MKYEQKEKVNGKFFCGQLEREKERSWIGRRPAASLILTMLAAGLVLLTGGIYPAGHWDHSTQLTTTNFDGFIKDNVEAGKTTFVRWIASAG